MRLVTYSFGMGGGRLGVLVDGLVVDVDRLGAAYDVALPSDMLAFIDGSVTFLPILQETLKESAGRLPAASWPA